MSITYHNCLQFRFLGCGSEVSRAFRGGTEVSRDTSVLGPKCLGSEVSGKHTQAYCRIASVLFHMCEALKRN